MEEAMAKEVTSKAETKVPVSTEEKPVAVPSFMQSWRPFEALRREVDRIFEDFTFNRFRLPLRRPAFDVEPFWQPESWVAAPAIDLVERDNAFEVTAELPGLDEKNIEVKLSNGVLTIKGQKEEDKVEKKEDFHLRERRFGSFVRSLRIPDTVDIDKIEAAFKKGVLTVTLPKTPEAQKPVKKIEVKGG
jgi:HSP20 family protein